MIDPSHRSTALIWTAVYLVVAITVDLWWTLAAPYIAAYYRIAISDSDRAIVGQVVTGINNAFMLVVGYFFGIAASERMNQKMPKPPTDGNLSS